MRCDVIPWWPIHTVHEVWTSFNSAQCQLPNAQTNQNHLFYLSTQHHTSCMHVPHTHKNANINNDQQIQLGCAIKNTAIYSRSLAGPWLFTNTDLRPVKSHVIDNQNNVIFWFRLLRFFQDPKQVYATIHHIDEQENSNIWSITDIRQFIGQKQIKTIANKTQLFYKLHEELELNITFKISRILTCNFGKSKFFQ